MCNTEDFLHYDYVRLAWDIGFTFEEYDSKRIFDIGLIGLVDVDRVAKERDIPTVVKHIPTLLNFRLDNDIGKVLEPNFIKLFRLSQLSIQYLRFCKKYLDSTVALLKNDILSLTADKDDLEACVEELKLENDSISRKYHELKATLSTSIYKCEDCGKTFYSEEYLHAHVKRRHEQIHHIQMQTESDKLQLEIKELKQRLNNTEKLILKEDKEEKKHKDGENEKEKEEESLEPNNDAIVDDTIQYKFEQLKNHIEAEINSLKNEDFYRGICEKYIKERVERKLSISTTPGTSAVELTDSQQSIIPVTENLPVTPESKKLADEATNKIKPIRISNESSKATEVRDVSEQPIKATESSTQTELMKAISEGTSMSPQPTPRKAKPHDHGDHKSIGENIESSSIDHDIIALEDTASMKTIEQKLAREVELQRETLEHILDLKLSGSLNKMEAQMTAFWEKLNAWESNLARPTKVTSSPGLQHNGHKESISNGTDTQQRKSFTFESLMESPIRVVPKALPRQIGVTKSVPKSAPTLKATTAKSDLSKFLESSEEDSVTEEDSERTNTDDMNEEEVPSNIKPSASFKKRLDETLLQRLKPKEIQTQVKQPILIETKPRVSKASESSGEDTTESKTKDNLKNDEIGSNHSTNNATNYRDLKNKLKKHVGDAVDQKLKDIGVSPHWNHLLDKSYTKAMEIIDHQANLSKKIIPDFHKLRKSIERTIDKELEKKATVPSANIRRNKRSASAILPTTASTNDNTQQARLMSTEPTPPESNQSESSLDIPPQRVSARPIIKATPARRHSTQTQSSPIKLHQSPTRQTFVQNVEVHPVQISPSPPKQVNTPSSAKTDNSVLVSSQGEIPLASSKKKVLFNLDSESDRSQYGQGEITNIASFVKHEKSKLEVQQAKKSNKNDLHTGSESSDWDISDIT